MYTSKTWCDQCIPGWADPGGGGPDPLFLTHYVGFLTLGPKLLGPTSTTILLLLLPLRGAATGGVWGVYTPPPTFLRQSVIFYFTR